MISEMTRSEMEVAIIADKFLYAQFDERRLLDGGYSDEQMREVMQAWVEAGDECANC